MKKALIGIGRTPVQQTYGLFSTEKIIITKGGKEMLSRDCDGCSQMKPCSKRFGIAEKGEKVYCPDGTAHLVDGY